MVIDVLNGRDASDPFVAYHPSAVTKMLAPYCVGEVKGYQPTELQKEYHRLSLELETSGMMQTTYSFYVKHLVFLASLFLGSIATVLCCDSLLVHALGGCLLGVFWQQLSFMGHDFGHKAVFHSKLWDTVGGVTGTLLMGVSGAWWRRVHNTHHVTTNSEEYDPDIQYLPIFAINKKACRDYFSFYHSRIFKFDSAAKVLVSLQHLLYLPILSVARFNLYALSWHHVWRQDLRVTKDVVMERVALVLFVVWNLWLLSHLPNLLHVAVYVLLSHQLCGIVHLQIVLSHFAMETYHSLGYTPDSRDFLRMQLATTMDVDCHPWVDWFHGGLQFQVTHHLFPRLPRHRLREVLERKVKPLCRKYGIRYHSYSFLEGNMMVYRSMREAALLAGKQRGEVFANSYLWKLLLAQG